MVIQSAIIILYNLNYLTSLLFSTFVSEYICQDFEDKYDTA